MNKLRFRTLLLLIICLMIGLSVSSGQAPESYILTMWTFDESERYEEGKRIEADISRLPEANVLSMFGGEIDRGGGSGTNFTDLCGIKHNDSNAIRWSEVRGENDNITEDDAQLQVTVNTTDWKDLAFRFFYRSEHVDSFDLYYHLGDGNWKLAANDVVIDAIDDWNNIAVGLADIDDIENRSVVVFLVNDFTQNNGRGEFRMDNIIINGQRISSPMDCSPVLEPLNPIEDIVVFLNSGNIPTFTENNGFQFQVIDDKNAFNELTIVALSSDPNVINQLGLAPVDPGNGIFRLDIGSPHGFSGIADVIVRVTDSSGNMSEHVIQYGVSDVLTTDVTHYHRGTSHASTALAVDDAFMLVANDDNQQIDLYHRNQSSFPIVSFDLSDNLELEDRRDDNTFPTVDIEASTQINNRQYWLGSHSNSDNGRQQPNRYRLFATDTSGQGAGIQVSFVGYYDELLDDIDRWADDNDLRIRFNRQPDDVNGLNIEGFSLAPDGQTAYIAFRTPLIPRNEHTHALIAPLQNFTQWFNNGSPDGRAQFADPIPLDLGGLSIRGLECNANGCLIIAGSVDDEGLFALYTWSGDPNDAPVLRNANLTGLQPESVILPSGTAFGAGTVVQLISDNGDTDWYQTGDDTSDLPEQFQFFRSDYVVIE